GFDDVRDRAVFFVDDVDDTERADGAGIERLPAGGRIKGGAIEGDEEAIATVVDALDRRLKRPEIRVGVVEALGHRGWTTWLAEAAPGTGPPVRRPAARRRTWRRPIGSRGIRSRRRTSR